MKQQSQPKKKISVIDQISLFDIAQSNNYRLFIEMENINFYLYFGFFFLLNLNQKWDLYLESGSLTSLQHCKQNVRGYGNFQRWKVQCVLVMLKLHHFLMNSRILIFVFFLKLIHHLVFTGTEMKWRFYFKNKRPHRGLTDADSKLQIDGNISNSGTNYV